MTRSGASPASPRHHAIAAHLHQEKAAPLHRRTVELELALTTDELAAAQASVRELSAALENAQALKAEREMRAEAERATAKAWLARQAAWADELGRLEGEAQFWQDCYRNVTKQEVHKPGGGRLAKPFAPMIEVGARSPVRGLRLPKAAAEVPVSPRPTTVLVK